MENSQDPKRILRELLASQKLAVISTQSEGQPYSNLVAFAETDDSRHLIFVTHRNTKKYTNIKTNRKVAVLIDSRTNQSVDFSAAIAVTAIGYADEASGNERERLAGIYITKHPHLADFSRRPAHAIIKIKITDYIIAKFDKVETIQVSN